MIGKETYRYCKIVPIHLKMVYAYLIKGAKGKSILIDCGMPGSEKAILRKMAEVGIRNPDLALIVITHGHSDHMGASSALRKITGAKTAIHKLDAQVLRTGKNLQVSPTNRKGRLFSRFMEERIPGFEPYEPDILINGEMPLDEFGIAGKIIETPGHTDGSVSIVLRDGNFFVGDLIMGGMIGRGKPDFPMYAQSIRDTRESIRKVVSLSPKVVHPGHGGPFTLEQIQRSIRGLTGADSEE